MTFVPDLYVLTNGTIEATCGKCLKISPSMKAADKEAAWGQLLKLGWSTYQARPGTREYAVCPSCTANPGSIDDAVKSAHKARKRK